MQNRTAYEFSHSLGRILTVVERPGADVKTSTVLRTEGPRAKAEPADVLAHRSIQPDYTKVKLLVAEDAPARVYIKLCAAEEIKRCGIYLTSGHHGHARGLASKLVAE